MLRAAVLLGLALICAGSFATVLINAAEEPYSVFRAFDAWSQVGVAASVATLSVVWTLLVVASVMTRKLGPRWLAGFLLVGPSTWISVVCADSYTRELRGATRQQPVVPASDVADFLARALDEARHADAEMIARGGRTGIVEAATLLQGEHSAILAEVEEFRRQRKLGPPSGRFIAQPVSGVASLEKDVQRTGKAFDLAYADHMIQFHRIVLDILALATEQAPDDADIAELERITRVRLLDLLALSRQAATDPEQVPRVPPRP